MDRDPGGGLPASEKLKLQKDGHITVTLRARGTIRKMNKFQTNGAGGKGGRGAKELQFCKNVRIEKRMEAEKNKLSSRNEK